MPQTVEININHLFDNDTLRNEFEKGTNLFIDGLNLNTTYDTIFSNYRKQMLPQSHEENAHYVEPTELPYTKEEILKTALALGRRVAIYPTNPETGLALEEPIEFSLTEDSVISNKWNEANNILQFSTSPVEENKAQYIQSEMTALTKARKIHAIEQSSHYKNIEAAKKNLWDVLGPLNQAMFPEYAPKEYDKNVYLFSPGFPNNEPQFDNLHRSGTLFSIAYLISQNHSIDDIFDPNKLVEEKKNAGDKIIDLYGKKNKEELIKIYLSASDTIATYLADKTKDNFFENLNDSKSIALRYALFDMNQVIGDNKQLAKRIIRDGFIQEGKENVDQLTEDHFNKIYDASLFHQNLALLGEKAFSILKTSEDLETYENNIRQYLAHQTTWELYKNDIKNMINNRDHITSNDLNQFLISYTNDANLLIMENTREDIDLLDLLLAKSNTEDNYKNYCKELVGPQLQNAFGQNYKEAHFTDPNYRIFIDGKSLHFWLNGDEARDLNLNNEDYLDNLSVYMVEALAAGKRVSLYPLDPNTNETSTEPILFDPNLIPHYQKVTLSEKLPKTSISTTPKLSTENALAAENNNLTILKQMESIYKSSGYDLLSNVRLNNNLSSVVLAESIFGKDASKVYLKDDGLSLVSTGLHSKDIFDFSRSGLALGVAALLSKGFTLEEITDTSVRADEKLAIGKEVLELANQGEEGRRKMALMAADATEKIYNAQYIQVSSNIIENAGDFRTNFTSRIMFDLNQLMQTGRLNLEDAYRVKHKQENPELKDEAINAMANRDYERINSLVGPYQMARRVNTIAETLSITEHESCPETWAGNFLAYAHEIQNNHAFYFDENLYNTKIADERYVKLGANTGTNLYLFQDLAKAAGKDTYSLLMESGGLEDMQSNISVRYQYHALKHLAKDMDAADPGYIHSSKEFKGMKAAISDLLKHYEAGFDNATPQWHETLEKKYQTLINHNLQYLNLKHGIEMKDGSLAKRRYDIARRTIDFSKNATKLLRQRSDLALETRKQALIDNEKNDIAIEKSFHKRFNQIFHPIKKEVDPNLPERELEFMNNVMNVRPEDSNITELAGFTQKEVSLFTILNSCTYSSSQHLMGQKISSIDDDTFNHPMDIKNHIVSRTAALVEDIYKLRKVTEAHHIPMVENGRRYVKEALADYNNTKNDFAAKLAEGLKTYTATFASFSRGYSNVPTLRTTALTKAAQIYDMLMAHPDLLKRIKNSGVLDKKEFTEVLETYRGAKMTNEIYKNYRKAKLTLLQEDLFVSKLPQSQLKIKKALVDITLKNLMNETMAQHQAADGEEAVQRAANLMENADSNINVGLATIAESFKVKMSKAQKRLTPEKLEEYREKLMHSKTIDKIANNLTSANIVEMFENETEVFRSVMDRIKEKEPSLLKDSKVHFDKTVNQMEQQQAAPFMNGL